MDDFKSVNDWLRESLIEDLQLHQLNEQVFLIWVSYCFHFTYIYLVVIAAMLAMVVVSFLCWHTAVEID